jgi:hypothetical protein
MIASACGPIGASLPLAQPSAKGAQLRQAVERGLFIMQIAATPDTDTIAALDQMKRSVRVAFCGIMQSTRLPPMAALSLAATAVGLLYLEVAAAHEGDNACPCGWEPCNAADLEALQTSLALAAKPHRPADFHTLQVEGHA